MLRLTSRVSKSSGSALQRLSYDCGFAKIRPDKSFVFNEHFCQRSIVGQPLQPGRGTRTAMKCTAGGRSSFLSCHRGSRKGRAALAYCAASSGLDLYPIQLPQGSRAHFRLLSHTGSAVSRRHCCPKWRRNSYLSQARGGDPHHQQLRSAGALLTGRAELLYHLDVPLHFNSWVSRVGR